MKPHRIILIRHGESCANTDESMFASQPDYTIELTEKGLEQARTAGRKLKELVGNETCYFYVSPFWRTRSTFEQVAAALPRHQFIYSEEPRLREQEWGYLRTYSELIRLKEDRKKYGIFYYRFPGGEAGTDVYDRINDLLGSLHRDFLSDDYPQNCVLITHSLAIRLFVMRWFHLTVEEFEQMQSPANGELVVLEYNALKDEYVLATPLSQSDRPVLRSRPIHLTHSPKRLFLLGGMDLEMQTIRELLLKKGEWVADLRLTWQKACLSQYATACSEAIRQEIPIYGIELREDVALPPLYHRIDHHNDYADKPSALEQVMELLHQPMNRYSLLVAANDKGYIPALQAMGAAESEIEAIRLADRKAQGVSNEEEKLAEKAISAQAEAFGNGWIVKALCNRFSPICDRLFPYEWLLVYTDQEWTYYGKEATAVANIFSDEVSYGKVYYGGGPNGYAGAAGGCFTENEINHMVEQIKSCKR